MELSAFFPTRTIGNDPAKIRDWAQAVEDLGYDHIPRYPTCLRRHGTRRLAADLRRKRCVPRNLHDARVPCRRDPKGPRLASGVLILPQRQTGLVAKQAAEVDVLSGGRLRLGIGVGWNHVEYQSLGAAWNTRGAMQAEQIACDAAPVDRRPRHFQWPLPHLESVNILPAPVQRPIPIWFGGSSDAVVKRAARAWRRLDANHGARRAGRGDSRNTPRASEGVRTGYNQVRLWRGGCGCASPTRRNGEPAQRAGAGSTPIS